MWILALHEYYTILHMRMVSGGKRLRLCEMSVVWCSVSVV